MERRFKMKYNFYEKDIKKDAILNWITVINNYYLVEDIETKNRAWVSKYDIERIDDSDN